MKINPTILVATAAVLSTSNNGVLHYDMPGCNHNAIKPIIANQVAQSVVQEGARSEPFETFGLDMKFGKCRDFTKK